MKKTLYALILLALGVTACYKSDTISSKNADSVLIEADTLLPSDNIKISGDLHQSVPDSTDKYILVTAKVDKTGKIVEDRFVNIEITDKLDLPKNLRIGERLFFGESGDFKKYGDKTIAVLRGFGFESVDHLISIWDKNDDNYVLTTILDQRLSVGIGTVQVDTLLDLSPNKSLIIGEKFGGDAGETWGSMWIGIWTKPRTLEIAYEKEWEGSDWLGYTEVIDYTISDDLIMTIETLKRYGSSISGKDSLVSSESIDLKTFR